MSELSTLRAARAPHTNRPHPHTPPSHTATDLQLWQESQIFSGVGVDWQQSDTGDVPLDGPT